MRYAFLAILSFLILSPATAFAQHAPAPQIVVPQCPSDADCYFHGEGHVFEQYSSNGGGYYPPPYYGGGGYGYSGGRAQNNVNLTFMFGAGGQGRGGGGQVQLRCNPGDQIVNGQCYHQGGRILSVSCPRGGVPVERSPGYWECVR